MRTFFKEAIPGLLFALLAVGGALVVRLMPLQRYIEISRFQHYAIAMWVGAAGFLLQLTVCFRRYSIWGRLALFLGILWLGGLACFFYANPWLDSAVAVESVAQNEALRVYALGFGSSLFLVLIASLGWLVDTVDRRALAAKNARRGDQ